jgi:hypothetical protein
MHTIAKLPNRLEYYYTHLPFAFLFLLLLYAFHHFLMSIVGALTHGLVLGTFL